MEKPMHNMARQQSKTYRDTWETLELWLHQRELVLKRFLLCILKASQWRDAVFSWEGEGVARVRLPLISCITEVAERRKKPSHISNIFLLILDANSFQGEWWILISFTTAPSTAIFQRIPGNPLYKQVLLNHLHSGNVPVHIFKYPNSLYMSFNARAYQNLAELNILSSSNWMFFLVKDSGQRFLLTVTHFWMVPIYPHGDLILERKCQN